MKDNSTPTPPLPIRKLTAAEEAQMQTLWRLEVFELKNVLTHLEDPKPHPNTVATFLKILTEKQFLEKERSGRIYRYRTILPQEDYARHILQDLISHYYHSPEIFLREAARIFETGGNGKLWQSAIEDFTTEQDEKPRKEGHRKAKVKKSHKGKKSKKH